MLQAYGASLAVRLLLRGHFSRAARLLAYPVNYWRHAEYAVTRAALGSTAGRRVLDVGSPKLFSLYLAARCGAAVEATDLLDYFIPEYRLLRAVEHLPEERYHMAVADGRKLDYPDASFDDVYSISVIEHIPDEGDSECVREMARVLRPGGRCILTVPFARTTRDEYRASDFYWSATGVADAARGGKVFYQRRYDEGDLRRRLIEPSGLSLRSLSYIGERIFAGSPDKELVNYLATWTGPLHGLLAKIFLTPPAPDWRTLKKPLCAVIVLEKAGAPL